MKAACLVVVLAVMLAGCSTGPEPLNDSERSSAISQVRNLWQDCFDIEHVDVVSVGLADMTSAYAAPIDEGRRIAVVTTSNGAEIWTHLDGPTKGNARAVNPAAQKMEKRCPG